MAGILWGDIWQAGLNPTKGLEQAGIRPVVIISHDIFSCKSRTVIAMAVTSQPQRAGFPLTYELNSGDLPKQSCVKISHIRTIPTSRLDRKIGRVIRKNRISLSKV